MINRAKRRGLANLRPVVIAPLLDANLTHVDGEILDDLQDKFEIVAHPDNIDVQRHPDNVAWFLTIDGDKTFTYGKDGSSSGEDEDDEDEEGHEDENGEDDDDSEDDENSEE
ncbi:unnamed protein product [Clonostachys rhizophaga]|uniref:Uncharacterized protein n=1 Tax=Clonostachys rhizophaga TaxID=160324 RepID=A0A9N9YM44_9HYPO|nr:unnamed protein product [Clonostachys rhizophaga]